MNRTLLYPNMCLLKPKRSFGGPKTSLIAILGDALENFTDTCENNEPPADEEVPAGEAAAWEAPAEEAAVARDKTWRDPDIRGPVPPDETLRTQTSYDENQGSSAGQADNDQELHNGEVTNLYRMTKSMNPLDDVAENGEAAT